MSAAGNKFLFSRKLRLNVSCELLTDDSHEISSLIWILKATKFKKILSTTNFLVNGAKTCSMFSQNQTELGSFQFGWPEICTNLARTSLFNMSWII